MSAQEQFNRSSSEIYKKISKHVPEIEWKVHAPLIEKINKLKNQLHNNLIIYTTKQQIKKDIEAIAEISKHYDVIVLKELTKIHEQRISINQDNLEDIDLDSIKGELVLAISASPKENIDEPIDKDEILYNVNELGMKKAYQVLKTKYKISRNEFYKLAMELKNE